MRRHFRSFDITVLLTLVGLTFGVLAQAQQAPMCTPPPAGLVSWWTGDGNYKDIIGGNNGTPVGGVTFAPGEVGQAFSFNGVDSYVDIGNPPSLSISGAITVEAWINPTVVNTYRDILDQMSTNDNLGEVQLRINRFGTFDFFRRYLQGSILTQGTSTQTSAVAGIWQHVAAVYDGSAY